jgi:hypothetical protein
MTDLYFPVAGSLYDTTWIIWKRFIRIQKVPKRQIVRALVRLALNAFILLFLCCAQFDPKTILVVTSRVMDPFFLSVTVVWNTRTITLLVTLRTRTAKCSEFLQISRDFGAYFV